MMAESHRRNAARLAPDSSGRTHLTLRLEQEHHVLRDLVQLGAPGVEIGGAPVQSLLRNRLGAERRDERIDCPLDEVLINAAPLVQLSKGGLHPVRESPALRLRQTVDINAAEAVHDTDVAPLREERVPIDEAPQRDQRVDAARVAVVTQDARSSPPPDLTSIAHACQDRGGAGSDDAMTMRSMSIAVGRGKREARGRGRPAS
jgi:hypothetical protein